LKYSELGIKKINEVDILNNNDLNQIKSITGELQKCYEKKQIWRSEVEMKYSVLDNVNFPTDSAKYWQSVREQAVFYSELIQLAISFEENISQKELLEIELEEIDKTTRKGKLNARIKNAEIKRKEFYILEMKIQAKDRVREIMLWEKIKNELKEKSDFNTEDFSSHHLETYEKRWKKEIDIATRTNNPSLYKNASKNYNSLIGDKIE
tara:strand:+ start:394 stop:1017 length:624 start_codon:yes stop_codon:yes gene_type:complete